MKRRKILWVVDAHDGAYGEINYVYAESEHEAREMVQDWLEQRSHFPFHEVQAFPYGFQIQRQRLPGFIE